MKYLCLILLIVLCSMTATNAQETTTFAYTQVAEIGRGNIVRINWSPDSEQIAVTTSRGIWFYDANDMRQGARLLVPVGMDTTQPVAIALDNQWSQVAALNIDGGVSVWSLPEGVETHTFDIHPFQIEQLAFSPDGTQLAAAGHTGWVLWDMTDGTMRHSAAFADVDDRFRDDLASRVDEIAFSPDAARVGITTTLTTIDEANLRLYIFDVATGALLNIEGLAYEDTMDALGAAFEQIDKLTWRVMRQYADSNHDGRGETFIRALFSYDLMDGEENFVAALPTQNNDLEYDNNRRFVTISPDETRIAIAEPAYDGMLRVWDIQDAIDNPPCLIAPPTGSTSGSDPSPDVPGLSACDPPWSARVTQTDAHRPPFPDLTSKTYRRDAEGAYVSLDDRWRLIEDRRSDDGPIVLESAAGERTGLTIQTFDPKVHDVVFTPDGRRVIAMISACPRDCVRTDLYIWDTSNEVMDPEPSAFVEAHTRGSFFTGEIALSPDARLVVTTGTDNTARVWDSVTLAFIAELKHKTTLRSATFGATSDTIITSGSNGVVYVWQRDNDTE